MYTTSTPARLLAAHDLGTPPRSAAGNLGVRSGPTQVESDALSEGCVALIAPIAMHEAPAYEEARELIEGRHPKATLLADRGLFEGFADWSRRYKEVFGVADRLYVLTAEDGTVGRGTYQVWEFLSQEKDIPSTTLIPDPVGGFEECSEGFRLEVIDEDNLTRYAAPTADREAN